jgi:DNA-directed RNA polymerase subunit RPC12/RpoP
MGQKVICLDCRKSFSQGTDVNDRKEANCPECGRPMILLPHRFRPPKRTDDKRWETVKFLIENGFCYQHIYLKIETKNGVTGYENYAKYPDNMRDAKEFVIKYKSQAWDNYENR